MLKRKKKVLMGMSGGVDSSVAACLLLQQGYEVVGVHMKYWAGSNRCCTVESELKAIYVCRKLKIPLMIFDFRKEFKRKIVDYYITATGQGVTPNPCVECNRTVKFGLFLEKMKELGADYVATGHYARIRKSGYEGNVRAKKTQQLELLEGVDKNKDQSYFLYTLTQEKLRRILFPLGDLTKVEVRKLAVKFGLEEINEQKESQNLCFIPDDSREDFLRRHLGAKNLRPGAIINGEGKILGKHCGLPMYTIGQRKGICIGGGAPLYVVKSDHKKNILHVGSEKELYRKSAILNNVTFVSGKSPSMTGNAAVRGIRINAKIRYRHESVPALLKKTEVVFETPQRAVTPGQSVVFYNGEKVLGGGIIT